MVSWLWRSRVNRFEASFAPLTGLLAQASADADENVPIKVLPPKVDSASLCVGNLELDGEKGHGGREGSSEEEDPRPRRKHNDTMHFAASVRAAMELGHSLDTPVTHLVGGSVVIASRTQQPSSQSWSVFTARVTAWR